MRIKDSIHYKCMLCGQEYKSNNIKQKQILLSSEDSGITNDGCFKELRRATVCPDCYESYWSVLNLNFPHFKVDSGKITIEGVDDGDLDNKYNKANYENDLEESIVDDYEFRW